MTGFIDEHRGRFGVEPICRVLEAAPSSYYARKIRPRCRRAREDEQLLERIRVVHASNYRCYGSRRVWRQLQREGIAIGRCRVERVMRAAALQGVRRGKRCPG
jgi:putative transposase